PEPAAQAQSFELAPASKKPILQPEQKPDPKLQTAAQMPARAAIILSAAPLHQPEVRDLLQPAQAKVTPDRLTDHAAQIESPRGPSPDEGRAAAKSGTDVNPGKHAGGLSQRTGKPAPAKQRTARTRLALDSLASAPAVRSEGKHNALEDFPPQAAEHASRLEPLRMNDQQTLLPATPASAPGPAPTQGRPRAWTDAKEKNSDPALLEKASGKPQPLATDSAPSKDTTMLGINSDGLAGSASKAPSVRDDVSALPAEHPGVLALGAPAQAMAMINSDQPATTPGNDAPGPSELATGKQAGGLAGATVEMNRVAPDQIAGKRGAGVRAGTLIEESGGERQASKTASTKNHEQLAGASSGSATPGGQSLTDIGAPMHALPVAKGGGSPHAGSDLQAVALTPDRTTQAGVLAGDGVGALARPSPAGRSALPAGLNSLVGQAASGTGSRVVNPAVSGSEQVDTGNSLTLADSAGKALLAGQIKIDRLQAEPAGAGQGSGAGAGGASELSPGKAVAGGVMIAGVERQRFQTADGGNAGGTPNGAAGTLVNPGGLQTTASIAASGTAGKESLSAIGTSASTLDSGGPAMRASTVTAPATSGGGSPEAGSAPNGPLQVAKADGGNLMAGDRAGSGHADVEAAAGGTGERNSGRIEMSLQTGQAQALVSSDISLSATAGQEGFHSFLTVGNAPNPAFLPQKAIYKMRKPEKRKQFIKELGGTAQTEQAVEQALKWLGSSQSDDGRWDVDGFKTLKECGGAGDLANEDMVVTGMSLLAYLGAGYTHIDGAHKEAVRKGLDWLLNCEKENGDFRGAGQMYGQAIATAVLCESYSLTGDERLLAPARRAVNFIVNSQSAESGWRYAPRNENDTSVTGWQILALKSAQIAGIAVPEQTFRWTELWLEKVRQGPAGGLYSYKVGHAVTPVMTAEGAFCQLFTGAETKTAGTRESIAYFMNNLPAWDPQSRSIHMYYWYYATMAIYLSGAQEFTAWNTALTSALLKGRQTAGPAAGSWDPLCQLGPRGGRTYSTAIGALCLEVYYRFLPLYKQKGL
ncbi:MAG: hypothetical protein WCL16_10180, partial [bacterium]